MESRSLYAKILSTMRSNFHHLDLILLGLHVAGTRSEKKDDDNQISGPESSS